MDITVENRMINRAANPQYVRRYISGTSYFFFTQLYLVRTYVHLDNEDEEENRHAYVPVSYTHLTLPTTPYV